MAKLRETSVQDKLTITSTDTSTTKGLTLSDVSGDNNSSVNFKNENGNLNITFENNFDAVQSLNVKECDVNIDKTLSAENIILPGGEITIDNTLDSDNNLVFSGIDIKKETLPNSIAETVQSSSYITLGKNTINIIKPSVFEVLLADDIDINKGVDNSVFSNIEDIIYESGGAYYVDPSSVQITVYTWVLKIEDAEGNIVTANVTVDLSGEDITGDGGNSNITG